MQPASAFVVAVLATCIIVCNCPALFLQLVAYPLSLLGVSIRAMENALAGLKEGRVPTYQQLGTFQDIQAAVGFPVGAQKPPTKSRAAGAWVGGLQKTLCGRFGYSRQHTWSAKAASGVVCRFS